MQVQIFEFKLMQFTMGVFHFIGNNVLLATADNRNLQLLHGLRVEQSTDAARAALEQLSNAVPRPYR